MIEEVFQVAIVVVDRSIRHKTEDFHGSVHAFPQFPGVTANVDVALALADGIDAAQATEPV